MLAEGKPIDELLRDAFHDEDQALAERLRDAFRNFEREGVGVLERLAPLYDPNVVFRDPLQTIHGRDAFLAMNRRIMGRARRLSFEVTDAVGREGTLFLAWKMMYEPHVGPTLSFEGATHARVRKGRIVEQRDHWDMLSTVAASLPLVRHVYAALAPHLG